jgi:hypothetical protein
VNGGGIIMFDLCNFTLCYTFFGTHVLHKLSKIYIHPFQLIIVVLPFCAVSIATDCRVDN